MKVVNKSINITAAATELVATARDYLASRSGYSDVRSPIRFEQPIEDVDPLDWLESVEGDVKVYWRSRDAKFEIAGVDVADEVDLAANDAFTRIDAIAERLRGARTECRYFGGLRFDPLEREKEISSDWKSFGLGRFWLPRWTITRRGNEVTLGFHCKPRKRYVEEAAERLPNQNLETARPGPATVGIVDREDAPDFDRWQHSVENVLAAIKSDRCEKSVMARRTRLDLSESISPWYLLGLLRRDSCNAGLFGFQTEPDTCFLGATPERLYLRRSDLLASEAVAGTRPRGNSEIIDAALSKELLASEKDVREHRYVVNSVRTHLATVCVELDIDPRPQILKLSRVQHLRTGVHGKLNQSVLDGRLLSLVHPTPAVNGYPRSAALNLIRELEPFDRGWYAGAVGWIGRDQAEFSVAIRSALLRGAALILYSGAGIVEGSAAEKEWSELEHKIALYTSAFDNNE